jgi:DNA primase small subunit
MFYNRREISYIVRQINGEEFCIRNMSYSDVDKFRKDIQKLVPVRIDVGPIYDNDAYYNKDVSKKGTAVAREFVIDIDMNDYNDIRTCCTGKTLCEKCWTFLVVAYEVLKELLENHLGFKHILWVFSGRRGIHAWVSDKAAKNMSNKIRKSLTEVLNFTINSDKMNFLLKPSLIMKKRYPPLE